MYVGLLPVYVLLSRHVKVDCLYLMDSRAINHVLTHSVDYQKSSEARMVLTKLLGNGVSRNTVCLSDSVNKLSCTRHSRYRRFVLLKDLNR